MNKMLDSHCLGKSFVAVLDILGISQLMSNASAKDLCRIANSIKTPFENVRLCMPRFLSDLPNARWAESYLQSDFWASSSMISVWAAKMLRLMA